MGSIFRLESHSLLVSEVLQTKFLWICCFQAHDEGYDFKGGAGAPSETKQGVEKVGLNYAEQESPKTDLEDDFSDCQNNFDDLTEVTPVRHSARTAGKRFKYLPCLLFLIDSTIVI